MTETVRESVPHAAADDGVLARRAHWILRVGMSGCYIGHGAFGVIGKEAWLPYFGVFGIPEAVAWELMPLVGLMDIALGIVILLRPMPIVMLHLAFWGVMTASLRPLTGEPFSELLERAGNYSVPLAFLLLTGWCGWQLRCWFARAVDPQLTPHNVAPVAWTLRIGTAALLVGHGAFGALDRKDVWFDYLGALGISEQTALSLRLLDVIGWLEIALGLTILLAPLPALLLLAFAWKLGTELLRPLAGEPWWEFIERAGSYAAPLALYVVSSWARDVLGHWRDAYRPRTTADTSG